jgi:hypothetical protein
LRWDLAGNCFVELPAVCCNGEDLFKLTDQDHFYDTSHDDQIVRLFALEKGGEARCDDLEAVAEALRIQVDLRTPATRPAQALKLRRAHGFKSTEFILEKLVPWALQHNRKLLVVLVYSEGEIINCLKGGERFDTTFVDYLNRKKIKWIDALELHQVDYADFGCTPERYIDRLFTKPSAAAVFGLYNPLGNAFIAFAMKNDLVDWLDPKPPAYS